MESETCAPSSLSGARRPQVVVLAAGDKRAVAEQAQRLRPIIEQQADIAVFDLSFSADLASVPADLAVVLGGDGSILKAAHQMDRNQIPVVGVNLGKLGFLADLTIDQFVQRFPDVCAGRCGVVEHLMFECRVTRDATAVAEQRGLNEMAILAGPPFAILDVELYVDSELATTYSCDGLILSTPIGSTAHNLSAGGPILRQDLDAFVVSPISPHTLTNRPVVDAAHRIYEFVVPRPHQGTSLVIDGRLVTRITSKDRVRVERSPFRFRLVQVPGHGYYRTLREKLGWGGRIRT